MSELHRWVESLIFASERPVSPAELKRVLSSAGVNFSVPQVEEVVGELQEGYNRPDRGVHLIEVAGGWQFRTNPICADLVRRLLDIRPPRLSRAALECLAVVAYHQPVTRADVERIRGVDSSGTMRGLLERKLLREVGRKEAPGRPKLYSTSQDFLEFFGLRDLRELPNLREFEEVLEELRQMDPTLEEPQGEEEGASEEGEESPGEGKGFSGEGEEPQGKGEEEETGPVAPLAEAPSTETSPAEIPSDPERGNPPQE